MANSTIKRGADSCGFPDPIVLHATEDLNDVKLTGFYRWASTNKPTHYPLNESGKMIVINRSADEVDQLYFCANAANGSGMKIRTLFGTTWSDWQTIGTLHQETATTNAYGLAVVSNADKICGIVITDPVQCIPLYYSSSGIRVLKVTETSGTFTFSWLANTNITYKCVRG